MKELTFEELCQHAQQVIDANAAGSIPVVLAMIDRTETADDE